MKGTPMKPKTLNTISLPVLAIISTLAQTQAKQGSYPAMAPIGQYMMADRNAEITLARSAAPKAISADAEVLVLGPHGYETAVRGKNGFVCIVERGWEAPKDDPNFWNPKLRGPICLNPPAARSYLPLSMKKTQLILAGRSKDQMFDDTRIAFDNKQLPAIEPGAMSYMLSKDGYLSDTAGHWRPHLMFFVPLTAARAWGANLSGSPIIAAENAADRLTIFMVPVAKWSDGTADTSANH
jgi:hypothetical protein